MKGIILVLLVLATSFQASAKIHGWKGKVHLIAVPFIAGTGIYTDVRLLETARETGTKAGAITNLSLLAVQAGLGTTIFFGDDNQPKAIRIIHRIVGSSIIITSLWLNIQGTMDKGVPEPARITSYTHTVLAAAPLILFTF